MQQGVTIRVGPRSSKFPRMERAANRTTRRTDPHLALHLVTLTPPCRISSEVPRDLPTIRRRNWDVLIARGFIQKMRRLHKAEDRPSREPGTIRIAVTSCGPDQYSCETRPRIHPAGTSGRPTYPDCLATSVNSRRDRSKEPHAPIQHADTGSTFMLRGATRRILLSVQARRVAQRRQLHRRLSGQEMTSRVLLSDHFLPER